jgi:hypothetical protein
MPYWTEAIYTFIIPLLSERLIDSATKNVMKKKMGLSK